METTTTTTMALDLNHHNGNDHDDHNGNDHNNDNGSNHNDHNASNEPYKASLRCERGFDLRGRAQPDLSHRAHQLCQRLPGHLSEPPRVRVLVALQAGRGSRPLGPLLPLHTV